VVMYRRGPSSSGNKAPRRTPAKEEEPPSYALPKNVAVTAEEKTKFQRLQVEANRLSEADKQLLRKYDGCYRCRYFGHRSYECPKNGKPARAVNNNH
jgi:hypothetical protein